MELEFWLEVGEDGELYSVTEYPNGFISQWVVNATMDLNGYVYFVSL